MASKELTDIVALWDLFPDFDIMPMILRLGPMKTQQITVIVIQTIVYYTFFEKQLYGQLFAIYLI